MSQKRPPVVQCPSCKRAVVNRLIDYCQFCEAALPVELRLSPDEKRALIESDKSWREDVREKRKKPKPASIRLGGDGSCGGSCGGACGGDG
jgi:hypothetical protein